MLQTWQAAQEWEKNWHGDCVNSLNEELKQLTYARKMGLKLSPTLKTPYNFDLEGKTVLDIGGGAYSLLLKCSNFQQAAVIEPIHYPQWIHGRYEANRIKLIEHAAEDMYADENQIYEERIYDEVWIYNVLQHVQDPQKIVNNSRRAGKLIRIFEWVDNGISPGHIHDLKEEKLNEWLRGEGKVEFINEGGCVGKCYYGVFPT
jgi:2-polyprenyl-3-methyl-5-hydroxy-6-metoxy-1,4-benzoquinol methylase